MYLLLRCDAVLKCNSLFVIVSIHMCVPKGEYIIAVEFLFITLLHCQSASVELW